MNDKERMKIARGVKKAALVLKNARIVNVFTKELEDGDIAIQDGLIVGIGKYRGKEEVDLQGSYVAPGFIDGHVHIESSMVTPPQFANIVLPKGTTTIIADPHEIANVSGKEGIRYMLRSSKASFLDVFMMIPSSVPATTFETAGANVSVEDIAELALEDGVLGLGEVMNYPDVLKGEQTIHDKIRLMQPRPIDGHAPSLKGNDLNAYATAGVQTDHECSTVEEMLDRVRRGMYVHLREGSVTRNVRTLLKGVTDKNTERLLFCTDDKHPEDIKAEGHINYNVNLAIDHGIDPITAIKMATLNAATCYKLPRHGAIAPSYYADLVVFDSLEKIEPKAVYKRGTLVAKNNEPLIDAPTIKDATVSDTVHVDLDRLDFTLKLKKNTVKVIGLIKNNITTKRLNETVLIEDGAYKNDPEQDLLKLAVVERHKGSGDYGLALVKGFGLKNGALAMTIAHDSHNLVVVGDSDKAMRLATEKIVEISGGIVLVKDGEVEDALQLEIGGIMTTKPASKVAETLNRMKEKVRAMGLNPDIDDPFIQLAFLSLPVIPDLKLTDQGLFDVNAFKIVPIED